MKKRITGSLVLILGLTGTTGYFFSNGIEKEAEAEEALEAENEKKNYPTKEKSIGFYVGSELTEDGSTLIGGFGHEPSSHWIDIVPAQNHPEDTVMEVGVTEEASIEGELIEIPQTAHTNKYISSTYSEFAGFPPPLTNGGLNDKGLAARDIWSPSREELVEMTPEPQQGPNYSDLSRIAMERAGSAREAVEIIGALIDEHGYSTYGGNSHLFADENEGWVFINYAGGEGLWAAERLGADEVRVSYPGYINDFPVDFEDNENFMASSNLITFAEEQGWRDPDDESSVMNLQEVYGEPFPGEGIDKAEDHYTASRIPYDREEELEQMAPVSLEDMLALVRDPRWSNDFSGYGQVAQLKPEVDDQLQTLWLATTGAVTTPFVPIPIATEEVPPEFLQHRYLTKDGDSHFLSSDYAAQEASRFAVREFKRLMYYTCDNPEAFLHDVTGEIEQFERKMLNGQDSLEQEAARLLEAGETEEAGTFVTSYVNQRLLESLDLGMDLTDRVEEETRSEYGIRSPEGRDMEGETTPPSSQSMALEDNSEQVSCYDSSLDEYPREHGIYSKNSEK